MAAKCPVCGAPMQDETCGYCGHSEKKPAEPTAYATNISQQPIQPQVVQPQIVINNSPQSTMGFTPGISQKNKIVALLLVCLRITQSSWRTMQTSLQILENGKMLI